MENSATSRICTQEEATSFSWTSSMDDLIMFDTTTLFFSSSGNCSSASHGRAECSACSHRKPITVEVDDDLQDTATSSPHPAIAQTGRLSTKQKKKQREMVIITQAKKHKGKGSEFGEVEDRIEVGFVGRDKNCSTGLKHIGLCLVPVSMVVNYFG